MDHVLEKDPARSSTFISMGIIRKIGELQPLQELTEEWTNFKSQIQDSEHKV